MEKDAYEMISELKETLTEVANKATGLVADLTILEEKYKELESSNSDLDSDNDELREENDALTNEIDNLKECKGEPMLTLKEIIEKAESWDYGLKGRRTLETKQDLINAIKKEILYATSNN